MNYELTINRFGALVGSPDWRKVATSHFLTKDAVVNAFSEQAQKIAASAQMRSANSVISRIARDTLAGAPEMSLESNRNDPVEGIAISRVPDVALSDLESLSGAPLVCAFPSLRVACNANGLRWILRARASVTACALQSMERHAKLWWTFEGVPEDTSPDNRPTEEHVAALISLTKVMEEAAMKSLHEAYRETFQAVTGANLPGFDRALDRIQIAMADTSEHEVAAFVDALYFKGKTVSEIRANEMASFADSRAGLHEFEKFVEDVIPGVSEIGDDCVEVTDGVPGSRGVFYRAYDVSMPRTEIAGIARKTGSAVGSEFLPIEQQRQEKAENVLRVLSAARPISAWLANEEAQKIDKMSLN